MTYEELYKSYGSEPLILRYVDVLGDEYLINFYLSTSAGFVLEYVDLGHPIQIHGSDTVHQNYQVVGYRDGLLDYTYPVVPVCDCGALKSKELGHFDWCSYNKGVRV